MPIARSLTKPIKRSLRQRNSPQRFQKKDTQESSISIDSNPPVVQFKDSVKVFYSNQDDMDMDSTPKASSVPNTNTTQTSSRSSSVSSSKRQLRSRRGRATSSPVKYKPTSTEISLETISTICSLDNMDTEPASMKRRSCPPDFSKFSYPVLRDLCKTLGLKSKGRKELLVNRLCKNIAIRKTPLNSATPVSHTMSESEEQQNLSSALTTLPLTPDSEDSNNQSFHSIHSMDLEEIQSTENISMTTITSKVHSSVSNECQEDEEHPDDAHDAVLAAGVTHIPKSVNRQEGFQIAELHEYDFLTRAWKSPCTLIRLKIAPKHFQEGALRRAYMAEVLEQPNVKFVVKDYKESNVEPRILYKDVQMQIACQYYARALKKHIDGLNQPEVLATLEPQHQRTLSQCHPLQFADSFLIKIPSSNSEMNDLPGPEKALLYVGEYFIEGDYRKYNNNWGYVAKQSDFMNDYAQAFSHYTLEKSKGEVLICDLQGTKEQFTDPQIHTTNPDSGFGQGNMSLEGITKFKETHICRRVCKALKLTPFIKDNKKSD